MDSIRVNVDIDGQQELKCRVFRNAIFGDRPQSRATLKLQLDSRDNMISLCRNTEDIHDNSLFSKYHDKNCREENRFAGQLLT